MPVERFFPDRDSLFTALLQDCEEVLAAATENTQRVTMLVSGGSSPKPLYQQLALADLDWERINVALVDERWVDEQHAGSNAAFIKAQLLRNRAAAANFISMKTCDESPELGQLACEKNYRQLARPFDLCILGMGSDGHTASLFPQSKGLESALSAENDNLCAAITAHASEVTGDFLDRMSLTFSALMQSQQLHLLITGEEKLAVYRRAIENTDPSLMPVSAFLQQQDVPVYVYWAP